jgi:hypothetical protein
LTTDACAVLCEAITFGADLRHHGKQAVAVGLVWVSARNRIAKVIKKTVPALSTCIEHGTIASRRSLAKGEALKTRQREILFHQRRDVGFYSNDGVNKRD